MVTTKCRPLRVSPTNKSIHTRILKLEIHGPAVLITVNPTNKSIHTRILKQQGQSDGRVGGEAPQISRSTRGY